MQRESFVRHETVRATHPQGYRPHCRSLLCNHSRTCGLTIRCSEPGVSVSVATHASPWAGSLSWVVRPLCTQVAKLSSSSEFLLLRLPSRLRVVHRPIGSASCLE